MTRSLAESLAGGSPAQWANDFLHRAGLPITAANVQAVYSWEFAESAGGGGLFNPLNTTQGGYPGESNFNSVGVKNFVRRDDGLDANARVINNGLYPRVIAEFTRGLDARAICDAITASPWGTGPIALLDLPEPFPKPAPAIGDTMNVIASPHPPTIPGRIAVAVWDPAHPNNVYLENGASIREDRPDGEVRVWTPASIPPGVIGHGIALTVDHHGRPDGRGVVLLCSGSNTYIGLWS